MPYTWDVNAPQGTETRRQGDDRIRDIKVQLQQAFRDGPIANFPTDAHCTPGWPRIFVYATLALLQANAVVTPFNRLGFVTADADSTKNGMYLERSTGWVLIQG